MITVFPFATTSRPGLWLFAFSSAGATWRPINGHSAPDRFGPCWLGPPFWCGLVYFGLGIAWEAGILSLGLGPTHPCSTDVDMEPFSTSVNEVLS